MKIISVLALYIAFLIVVPLIANGTLQLSEDLSSQMANFNEAQWAVIHWPSLFYICGTFVLLHIFRQKTTSAESILKSRKNLEIEKDKLVALSQMVEAAPQELSTYEKLKREQSMDSLYGRLVTLISRGCSENDIRLKLSVEFGEVIKGSHELIRQKGMMGALMPLLGMIGTITGLMFIFSADQTLGGDIEDSFNHKFAGMGTALLTTLYSTLFTAMWFKPRQAALVNDLSHLQKDLELLGHHCLLFKNQLDLNLLHHHHMLEQSPGLTEIPEQTSEGNTDKDQASNFGNMELANGS